MNSFFLSRYVPENEPTGIQDVGLIKLSFVLPVFHLLGVIIQMNFRGFFTYNLKSPVVFLWLFVINEFLLHVLIKYLFHKIYLFCYHYVVGSERDVIFSVRIICCKVLSPLLRHVWSNPLTPLIPHLLTGTSTPAFCIRAWKRSYCAIDFISTVQHGNVHLPLTWCVCRKTSCGGWQCSLCVEYYLQSIEVLPAWYLK